MFNCKIFSKVSLGKVQSKGLLTNDYEFISQEEQMFHKFLKLPFAPFSGLILQPNKDIFVEIEKVIFNTHFNTFFVYTKGVNINVKDKDSQELFESKKRLYIQSNWKEAVN